MKLKVKLTGKELTAAYDTFMQELQLQVFRNDIHGTWMLGNELVIAISGANLSDMVRINEICKAHSMLYSIDMGNDDKGDGRLYPVLRICCTREEEMEITVK